MPRPISKNSIPSADACREALDAFIDAIEEHLNLNENEKDRIFVRELFLNIKKSEEKTGAYLMPEGSYAGVEFGE